MFRLLDTRSIRRIQVKHGISPQVSINSTSTEHTTYFHPFSKIKKNMNNRTDPNPHKSVKYATNIVGKTFTIIQTTDAKPGDILLNFQAPHIGYAVPAKVKKIRKITSEFYDIEFEGYENTTPLRFASSCLFGRQDGGRRL